MHRCKVHLVTAFGHFYPISAPFGRFFANKEDSQEAVFFVLYGKVVVDSNHVVHLASVRLGGDARDIKCDGSRSERTSRGA